MQTAKEIVNIPLDDSADHLAQLGRIVGHFAIMESSLCSAMEVLLGVDQFRGRFIFNSITSLRTKLDMLERLAHAFVKPSDAKDRLLSVLKRAGKANQKRNGLIHAIWGAGADTTLLTVMKTSFTSDPSEPYAHEQELTAKQLAEIVQVIDQISMDLKEFFIPHLMKIEISRSPLE